MIVKEVAGVLVMKPEGAGYEAYNLWDRIQLLEKEAARLVVRVVYIFASVLCFLIPVFDFAIKEVVVLMLEPVSDLAARVSAAEDEIRRFAEEKRCVEEGRKALELAEERHDQEAARPVPFQDVVRLPRRFQAPATSMGLYVSRESGRRDSPRIAQDI